MNNDSHNNSVGRAIKSFGSTEKILFWILAIILVISGARLVSRLNNSLLIEIPSSGGVFTEGIVGSPRFINPLLAISETDKAISSLVYSGLLRRDENGALVPDLAESYTISPDGLNYTFKIRDNAYFHDGKPVTTDDIEFTVDKAIDPSLKSPKRANWEGVNIEKINTKEISFSLKKPFHPFIDNLTLGILPMHIWQEASSEEFPFSQWNIEPIGAGPYKVSSIKRNGSGIPVVLNLSFYKKYHLGEVYISSIAFRFFQNEGELVDALNSHSVDAGSGLSGSVASKLTDELNIIDSPLPRIFGIFFNQNQVQVFSNIEVRRALDMSIDKSALVETTLSGYGIPLKGAIPLTSSIWENIGTTSGAELIEAARRILENNGWKAGEDRVLTKKVKATTYKLEFSISTSDTPELKQTAEVVADIWRRLGAQVDVKVFEQGDLNQNVIRPRKYDALLFGEVIGRDLDLYPFWHSSQRNDPGLNIAMYTNITTDKILEGIRESTSQGMLEDNIETLNTDIMADIPAVFLYAPKYIYPMWPKVKNIKINSFGNASERFASVQSWYIEQDRVWKIFNKITN